LLAKGAMLWERYGRIALGVLAAVAAAAAITFVTIRSRASAEEQAAGRLAEANVLYWQGEYVRSLELSRQISQQYPTTPSGVDAHRLAGDNAYWNGDFKTAVAEYRTYLEKQKKGVLADGVRRGLAYALESNQQFAEAAPAYEALVGRFDRESSAELLAAAARCYRAVNRRADAVRCLQRLVDEFGETSAVVMARTELAELSAAPH
jgi:tetratricopeptide (TPR) repeat protein